MVTEKLLCHIFRPVGQQSNAEEILLFGEMDRVLKELPPITFAVVMLMDYQIFKQDNETALGGADGKEQIGASPRWHRFAVVQKRAPGWVVRKSSANHEAVYLCPVESRLLE